MAIAGSLRTHSLHHANNHSAQATAVRQSTYANEAHADRHRSTALYVRVDATGFAQDSPRQNSSLQLAEHFQPRSSSRRDVRECDTAVSATYETLPSPLHGESHCRETIWNPDQASIPA